MSARTVVGAILVGSLAVGSGVLGVPALAADAAAGLTRAEVAQIANHVVTKRAAKLYVAHAASAGDSAALGGQPASSYLTHGVSFRLYADNTRTRFRSWELSGVPDGTYLISYDITFMPVSPGTASGVSCSLYQGASQNPQPASLGTSTGFTVTGSAMLSFSADGASPRLGCSSDGDGFTIADHRITDYDVTGVRIDDVTYAPINETGGN